MKRKWIVLALVLLLAAAAVWYFRPRPPRVLLVGVDAGADSQLDEYLTNGTLPDDGGFAELARRGVRAETCVPIDISLTAPSFASLYTGAYPERHGLMGNNYYRVRDPLGQTTSAFHAPLAAEPIWETLRRAGKRVVLVGNDIGVATPGQGPNLNLGFGESDGSSQLTELGAAAFAAAEGWQFGRKSFEHARAAQITFRTRNHGEHPAHVLAVDTVPDGAERFDRLLLDFDRNLGNGVAADLAPGARAAVRLPIEHPTAIGVWVKLLELAPDLSRVRIYLGAPHYNLGAPVEFLRRVERGVARMPGGQSFWPGSPDDRALDRGWIDEPTWFEQMERLGHYLRDAALWVIEHERFDLLITYQPQIDEAAHEFFLRHPRQAGYDDPALRARREENILRAWRAVDANLKALTGAAGRQTNVIVTADHGMIPVHTTVFPNRLLASQGLRVSGPEAQVRAVTSGSQGHVYVNLAGRQPGGGVAARDYAKMVARVVSLFAGLRDPATNEPVLEVIAPREAMAPFHILHEETTGDVWLSLKPGYIFSGDDRPGLLFEPAQPEGMHGYLAKFRAMETIFLAAGPQIRKGKLEKASLVDIAPTIARLLGAEPPRDAQGRVLEEILVRKE